MNPSINIGLPLALKSRFNAEYDRVTTLQYSPSTLATVEFLVGLRVYLYSKPRHVISCHGEVQMQGGVDSLFFLTSITYQCI